MFKEFIQNVQNNYSVQIIKNQVFLEEQQILVAFKCLIFKISCGCISQNLFQHMTEVKIENIETNFENILAQVGENSFVEWDSFTKSSTGLTKQMDELGKAMNIFREIQQRRFITTMKKLKGFDIPDLIKTVKSKKLPKEALKSIIGKFKLTEEKLQLVDTVETLKEQAKKAFDQYINANETITNKLRETAALLNDTIKSSGFYEEAPAPKELVSTFKFEFSEQKLEAAKSLVQVEYLPGTVDTLHIKTYAQIVDATLQLVKSEYKRLTDDARKRQRLLNPESKEYLDSLMEYLTNTEVLAIEGQKSIAGRLGVTPQKLEDTENVLMERGLAQNLLFIQSTLRTRVKESMVAVKEATLEKAREILNFQVSKLKSQSEHFKKMFSHLDKSPENYQLIPMLLALSLNDMVFVKYELEEEDFMKNVTDAVIMTNPEIMGIFKEMELAIIKLMQDLGIITQEAGNFMQAQTQQGINPNVPGLMPGMQPGTNPLQLLQLQQLQQFEQMQLQMQRAQQQK